MPRRRHAMSQLNFLIKITLIKTSNPTVSRLLSIPSDLHFSELHLAIAAAFAWDFSSDPCAIWLFRLCVDDAVKNADRPLANKTTFTIYATTPGFGLNQQPPAYKAGSKVGEWFGKQGEGKYWVYDYDLAKYHHAIEVVDTLSGDDQKGKISCLGGQGMIGRRAWQCSNMAGMEGAGKSVWELDMDALKARLDEVQNGFDERKKAEKSKKTHPRKTELTSKEMAGEKVRQRLTPAITVSTLSAAAKYTVPPATKTATPAPKASIPATKPTPVATKPAKPTAGQKTKPLNRDSSVSPKPTVSRTTKKPTPSDKAPSAPAKPTAPPTVNKTIVPDKALSAQVAAALLPTIDKPSTPKPSTPLIPPTATKLPPKLPNPERVAAATASKGTQTTAVPKAEDKPTNPPFPKRARGLWCVDAKQVVKKQKMSGSDEDTDDDVEFLGIGKVEKKETNVDKKEVVETKDMMGKMENVGKKKERKETIDTKVILDTKNTKETKDNKKAKQEVEEK